MCVGGRGGWCVDGICERETGAEGGRGRERGREGGGGTATAALIVSIEVVFKAVLAVMFEAV